MAYLSKGPTYGTFQKQVLTVNGTDTEFSLRYSVSSASSILVSVGGVIQEPSVAYSLTYGGAKILFAEAPTESTYILFLGRQFLVPTVSGYEVGLEQFVADGVSDKVTLSESPVVNSGIIVFIDGIQQSYGADKQYYISGLDVIFTSVPANGAVVDVYVLARERTSIDVVVDDTVTRNKLSSDIKHSVGQWVVVSTNTIASDGKWYMVDTLGGVVSITLPASPALGDTFKIVDYSGTFATNNCTLLRNGQKIEGITSDLVLDVSTADIEIRFTGSTYGWRVA